MLNLYSARSKKIKSVPLKGIIEPDAIWYDLYSPEPEEVFAIEEVLNIRIPTLEEMSEIEFSSRLYMENESLYMTFTIITSADSDHPISSPVTVILNSKQIITIRHTNPKAFQTFYKKVEKFSSDPITPDQFFFLLLETIVDRIADILEMIGLQIDDISKQIFQAKMRGESQNQMHGVLIHLGKKGDLNSKVRESLANINRLLVFFTAKNTIGNTKITSRITTLQQDVSSVIEQVSFLFKKINFLLEATLGLISIEQNAIIKIFSVAAVIFLPPTLIASIYGMNFRQIPELTWMAGYPFALLLMVISAVGPYLYFKKKGWL